MDTGSHMGVAVVNVAAVNVVVCAAVEDDVARSTIVAVVEIDADGIHHVHYDCYGFLHYLYQHYHVSVRLLLRICHTHSLVQTMMNACLPHYGRKTWIVESWNLFVNVLRIERGVVVGAVAGCWDDADSSQRHSLPKIENDHQQHRFRCFYYFH